MVTNKADILRRLKNGSSMIELQWGGYKYSIDYQTIRFNTARKLIKEGIVTEDMQRHQSPLLKYYKISEHYNKRM